MKKPLHNFPFPLTLQCTYENKEDYSLFCTLLSQLSDNGFYGIELNLPFLSLISPASLTELLNEYELTLTYLATGAYAKKRGLSLSDSNNTKRKAAVNGCKENIDYAADVKCGVIIGFFKGTASQNSVLSRPCLIESLKEITSYAELRNVDILLEATNHKECGLANTLSDTLTIAQTIASPKLHILPDTYHMNIEEANPFLALEKAYGRFPNLHISDDNRFFPGLGSLNFGTYCEQLLTLGYRGTLGIEGNTFNSIRSDIEHTVKYLSTLADTLHLCL